VLGDICSEPIGQEVLGGSLSPSSNPLCHC